MGGGKRRHGDPIRCPAGPSASTVPNHSDEHLATLRLTLFTSDKETTRIHGLTYALIFLFLLPAAASAQDKWQIEAYGGDYHLHGFDTEVTYGARAGVR